MGIFGKTRPRLASKPHQLKDGAFVPMQDVDPGFIQWARENKAQGRVGHKVQVRLDLEGSDIVARAGDGSVIGRMAPARVKHYYNEFSILRQRDRYGIATVEISPEGKTERYVICINFDENCRDGGIL